MPDVRCLPDPAGYAGLSGRISGKMKNPAGLFGWISGKMKNPAG